MSAEQEVEEHIHHAHEPFDKTVAGSMAIIAALLAVVSVLGQHYNTEKLLNQQLSSDQWAYYQAKDIRRYTAQVAQDTLRQMKGDARAVDKYANDEKKYQGQAAAIQEKAREFEKERDKAGRQGERFHLGEVFLEVAIVFSSLSILSKRKALFAAGVVATCIGVVLAGSGYFA